MKKLLMSIALLATLCAISLPANAQFGKALKGLEKSAKKSATNMASDAVANQASAKVVTYMDQQNAVAASDSEYAKRLDSIAAKFTSVDGLNLNYKVYENPEINIISCADGSIRVYSGMLDFLTNDEMLAVIATQMGHLANKDVRDAMMKVASGGNAEQASTAQLEKILSMSGDSFGTVINEFLQVPYTSEQNRKADEYAVKFLKNNNVETSALVSALNKFAELEAADAEALAEDELAEISAANKYNAVNADNATRANLI